MEDQRLCTRCNKSKRLKERCLPQAAQQIIELQEAAQINAGLQPANLGRNTSLHDMKTVVKTWRNRLPIVSDDLSHWSSIFMWRQHHYQGTDPPKIVDSKLKPVLTFVFKLSTMADYHLVVVVGLQYR